MKYVFKQARAAEDLVLEIALVHVSVCVCVRPKPINNQWHDMI